MTIEQFMVKDRECRGFVPEAYVNEPNKTAIYVLAGDDFPDQAPEIMQALSASTKPGALNPFLLISFAPIDWDRDYTPWPAPALSKKTEPFAGGAPALLAWLENDLRPAVCERFAVDPSADRHLLLGYSLGGLTALWAVYERSAFGGCASCSGSLWYDGFLAYALARKPREDARVYLSLGKSEEKARNPRMAAVGDATRAIAARLAADQRPGASELVWHEGGHFTQVPARMAAAIGWLMKK